MTSPDTAPGRYPAWDKTRKHRFFWNLSLLVLLWSDLFYNLSLEWKMNAQYGYGFMVPFLGLYLLYSRWEDRPPVLPPKLPGLALPALLIGVVLLLLPFRLVFEANPDWRLIMVSQALLVWIATLFSIYAFGGRNWLKHFFWGSLFLLIAVPWPTRIEAPLIQGLMRMVASVSVEFLNLLGIHARQSGNLIRLPHTLVGVEEACSGVRSFQSAIMASLFFGEFFRFKLNFRVGLIAAGILLSILLNLIRTFTLTLIAHKSGPEEMSHWHDPIGYFVYFGTFIFILGIAYGLRQRARSPRPYPATRSPFLRGSSKGLLTFQSLVVCFCLWLMGVLITQLYYDTRERPPEYLVNVETDFEKFDRPVRFVGISDLVRAQLRYEEGQQVVWRDPGKKQFWTLFFFTWEKGDVSSFVGVHRPEICLQAAGLILDENGPDVAWSHQNFNLIMNTYIFSAGRRKFHVFFSVWEKENGRHVPIAKNYDDRLERVKKGIRSGARQSLQIVITGANDLETATREAKHAMDQFLKVHIEDLS